VGNLILAENSTLLRNYKLEDLDVKLKVPPYELPMNKENISNYISFSNKISLNESALRKLENNGFVVTKNPYYAGEEDITSMYTILNQEGIPIFITTDSLLHLYYIQYDETLRRSKKGNFMIFFGRQIFPY
jgi:hypothetical protein